MHKKAAVWQKKPFPLYDEMLLLVDGRAATGKGVFRGENGSSDEGEENSDFEKV
jgi:hypothetical protein